MPGGNQLDTILPITQAIITSLDPDSILQILVQRLKELEGVKASAVYEYDERTSRLKVRCSVGLSKSYTRSMYVPVGVLAVGRAFQSGQMEMVGNIDADPSYAPYLRRMHKEDFEAVVAAPLVARQKLLGILTLYYHEPFTPSEYTVDTIRTLANLAAVALDNAKLFQAQLQATRELEILSKQLAEQREMLSRALKVHEWLVHTVLVHDGLDVVTSALAELANAPVLVEDIHLNVISFALPKANSFRKDSLPKGVGLSAFIDDERVRSHMDQVRLQRRPKMLPALPEIGLDTARITAPVFMDNKLLALVSLLATERDFTQEDFVLSEQGALGVALELMKAEAAFEAEQRLKGDFLQSLLAGQMDRLDTRAALVASNKFDLASLQRIIAIRPDRNGAGAPEEKAESGRITLHSQVYDLVERAIVSRYPKTMVIATSDGFTVLLGSDQMLSDETLRELGEQVVASVATSLLPITVSVGIGGVCRCLSDVRRSLNEARSALEMAAILEKRGWVILFADLGILEILLRQGRRDELRNFADRYIAPIVEYDEKHGSELYATLEAYVRLNYSLQDTAQALFLHPNSVRYRLQRVEDLCGISLRNSEDLMNIQIALRLYRLVAKRALEPLSR